ncbi:MAG: hypothetical protein JW755_09835 [Candidatus Aminicenantes bacterium]|nr:hypothetical protein [Candidatus Aminicenantes bacterium]
MRGIMLCGAFIFLLQIVIPGWWWIMVVPFFYGFLAAKKAWYALRTGMLAAGLLWLIWSLYFFVMGENIIASRVAVMFGFRYSWMMLVMTSLFAVLVAGLSGWAGYLLRSNK